MSDQTAIITGAAGGIGQATVAAFKRDGWLVVGVDLTEPPAVDRFIRCDLARIDEVERAGMEMADVGQVTALVNNAGVHFASDLLDTTADDWDQVMAVNARAAYLLTRLTRPLMQDAGGAVVNVSSVHALATTRGMTAYAASKGAIVAMTRALALDLGPEGIRVNAVLPGAIDTPMLLPGVTGGDRESGLDALASRTSLRRIGLPEDVAHAILFLADRNRSSFITGQTVVVDGGAMARLSSE